jgi:hypothetical protein
LVDFTHRRSEKLKEAVARCVFEDNCTIIPDNPSNKVPGPRLLRTIFVIRRLEGKTNDEDLRHVSLPSKPPLISKVFSMELKQLKQLFRVPFDCISWDRRRCDRRSSHDVKEDR